MLIRNITFIQKNNKIEKENNIKYDYQFIIFVIFLFNFSLILLLKNMNIIIELYWRIIEYRILDCSKNKLFIKVYWKLNYYILDFSDFEAIENNSSQ